VSLTRIRTAAWTERPTAGLGRICRDCIHQRPDAADVKFRCARNINNAGLHIEANLHYVGDGFDEVCGYHQREGALFAPPEPYGSEATGA